MKRMIDCAEYYGELSSPMRSCRLFRVVSSSVDARARRLGGDGASSEIARRRLAGFVDELRKDGFRVGEHRRRGIRGDEFTGVEADYYVVLDDGVDSVRDGEDGARAKFLRDDILHVFIRLGVDARRRFVETHHSRVPQHGAREAKHLPLAGGVVCTEFLHWSVET